MRQFIKDLATINNKLDELKQQRGKLVSDNADEILMSVRKMMDWRKDDIHHCRIEYHDFEQCVMIEIEIKKDLGARYVFEVDNKGRLSLRFREDYSMHC